MKTYYNESRIQTSPQDNTLPITYVQNCLTFISDTALSLPLLEHAITTNMHNMQIRITKIQIIMCHINSFLISYPNIYIYIYTRNIHTYYYSQNNSTTSIHIKVNNLNSSLFVEAGWLTMISARAYVIDR